MTAACPYLSSVNCRVLDFDFEKICSVTLSTLNVYACLTCGKYFQGRGQGTPAFMHALHQNHHIYMNLKTLKAYCLPEDYEIDDVPVLKVLRPQFTTEQVDNIDKNNSLKQDMHGRSFVDGFLGLNNLKANDYVNVVIQAMTHLPPLRDFFLLENEMKGTGNPSELIKSFGEVTRKMWNPYLFKAHLSPHEFLQTVSNASAKRFSLTLQKDPLDFLVWFLNTLAKDLSASIIIELFQGQVRVEQCQFDSNIGGKMDEFYMQIDGGNGSKKETNIISLNNFFFLALDLPPIPLFQDEKARKVIPQVPLSILLDKYNGGNLTYRQDKAFAYSVTKYPKYLILHMKRFTKTNFTEEKNPTIVNFAVDNVVFPIDPHSMNSESSLPPRYNLMANVYVEGTLKEHGFGVHLRCRASGQWFDVRDLQVKEIVPQMLFMSESYIQIWERCPDSAMEL